MGSVLETERLRLRKITFDDAPFILEILNEPSFVRFIGDKGVRTLEDARGYIVSGPLTSYERFGFGLWLAELKTSGEPIGLCGLLKRDSLPDVDIGYAFVPRFWRRGYAVEAAAAVKEHGMAALGLARLVGITSQDNASSIRVLENIGLHFERLITLPGDSEAVKLFATEG